MAFGKFFGAALAVALAVAAADAQQAAPPAETAVVSRVFDGDTVAVRIGRKKRNVRLLGIDAPEKDGPYTTAEPFGAEAASRAAQLALGETVTLVYAGDRREDRYGRALAYVVLPDGRSLGEVLLAEGLAEVFRKSRHPLKKRYQRLQSQARRQCLGMWKRRCAGRR